jgi:5-methylcytosine-specific restriction endonuclease McrA
VSAARSLGSWRWTRLRRLYAATLPATCERCGHMIERGDRWELDHRIPRAEGGAWYDPANLRPVHYACNRLDSWRLANLSRAGALTARPSRSW